MTSPDLPAWVGKADRLRKWFYTYAGLSIPGVSLSIFPLPFGNGPGGWLRILSLMAYGVAVVYAYRVQSDLRAAGLTRTGAWTVVAAVALILVLIGRTQGPETRGDVLLTMVLLVPAAVLSGVRRVKRSLAEAGNQSAGRIPKPLKAGPSFGRRASNPGPLGPKFGDTCEGAPPRGCAAHSCRNNEVRLQWESVLSIEGLCDSGSMVIAYSLGSTGSLSSASTPNTHSCGRRSGSWRTNRSSPKSLQYLAVLALIQFGPLVCS